MKRTVFAFCIIALLACLVLPWNVQAEATVCPYCGRSESEYIELTNDLDRFLVAGHYYMKGDVTRSKQLVLEAEGVSCLDLAGHTLLGDGRALQIGEDVTKPDVVLNVFDSVGGGKVVGKGSTNSSWSAGTIYMEPASTINLYSGTLTTYDTSKQTAAKGGVATINGTLNVYGGSVVGGKVGSYGGALWLQSGGTLKIAGGSVVSGTAPAAPCVYAHQSAKVILSGNGNVDNIAFVSTDADTLTVSGKFTGKAELTWDNLTSGTVIGISDNADLSGGILTVKDSKLTPMVSGNSIVVGEGSWCQACQRNVSWTHITDKDMDSITAFSAGHYRLAENVTTVQQSLKNMTGTICLDLAGYTYNASTRAFLLENPSGSTVKNTLNIMDSSAARTGALVGNGGSDAMASGVIRTYKNTVLNIYSGTIRFDDGGKVSAKDGGVMQLSGEANMYGGTLVGGKVARWGGAVSVGSGAILRISGGTVIPGNAGDMGDSVYIASGGKIELSGNANPQQILFADASIGNLTITGDYTGKTEIAFVTTPALGADIGNSSATVGTESISIAGTRHYAAVSGTDLVVKALTGAAIGKTYYNTLSAALTKAKAGDTVKLLSHSNETVTAPAGVILNLNGWNINGNLSGKVTVYDSATDDYTVNDLEGYGKITSVSTDVQPAQGYLALDDDGISFHKYTLKINKVNLRPGATGIYYTAQISMDEAVRAVADHYGIAVSVNTNTPAVDSDKSIFTVGTSSVLISGIMDGDSTDAVDAQTPIYGRPYIRFTDGTYHYGDIVSTTLQQVTETVDSKLWDHLTLAQNRAYMAMYESFGEDMKAWGLTNVADSQAKKASADDGVLKVIILGNSDSTDATNLLYEIFLAEGWKKENLVLGCMYESGCAISSHVKFAQNNMAEYKYYKNTGKNADGTWDCRENTTLEYALQDENWDVVILQDSNTVSGMQGFYENNPDVETLVTYVVNKVGYEPALLWHFVGANPEIPEPYMSYVLNDGSADGDNSDASENEGWVDDGTTEPEDLVWIFDIARPSAPKAWAKRYYQYWNNDREVMYNAIAANVRDYILGSDIYGFDGVIPSATSFQYAINTLGMTERDMYRDYTHKSDYGRVMVSYVWYATLTGQTELTDIQFTTVPAVLRQKKFVQYGDLVLTPEQIDALVQSVNHALRSPLEAPVPAQ